MPDLIELGTKYDTDKVGHDYLRHYAQHFEPWTHKPMTLLEIGVMKGASLRMWRDYFPQGMIYGIDIDQKTVFAEERIEVFCGAQNDTKFLEDVVAQTGPLDIVVDDGSHCGKDHVASFLALWLWVKSRGWYVIEDCQSIFNKCWTQPEDMTIFNVLTPRWEDILTGKGSIEEVFIVGTGPFSGLIMLKKR